MADGPVIVVSGTPRSGTSLMMQGLAAAGVPLLCDEHRAADASNPRGYFELEAVKATGRDPGWLDRAPGRAVKVIHALLGDLPVDRRYLVLFMERDPREVVASQNRMLARLGAPEERVDDARLVGIQRSQVARARAALERGDHFQWRSVSFARLVREPRRVAGALAPFLSLERAVLADALASVVSPELHRERVERRSESGACESL